jgi:hypothetical protein
MNERLCTSLQSGPRPFQGDFRHLRDMPAPMSWRGVPLRLRGCAIAGKLGNSIDRSSFLFKTYNPGGLEGVRQSDDSCFEIGPR